MFKKRIIPSVVIRNRRAINSYDEECRGGCSVVDICKEYIEYGADAIFISDLDASIDHKYNMDLICKISDFINIPLYYFGRVISKKTSNMVLSAGVDVSVLNSYAIKYPDMLKNMISEYGSENSVVRVDIIINERLGFEVLMDNGRSKTGINATYWINELENMGLREVFISFIDDLKNNTETSSYNIFLLNNFSRIPVILEGHFNNDDDFLKVFLESNVSGIMSPSYFYKDPYTISRLKNFLYKNNIDVSLDH